MKDIKWKGLFGMLVLTSLLACATKTDYEKLVETELEKGERHDSLFLGFYFGMPQQDFYTRCWQLNKKGLLRQGTENTTVLYELKDELKYPANMNFYPTFEAEKIASMPMTVEYQSWAPWNASVSADSLAPDLITLFKDWFGGHDFMELNHPKYGKLWVKVDGNRRITLYPVNGKFVQVLFTDLTNTGEPTEQGEEAVD